MRKIFCIMLFVVAIGVVGYNASDNKGATKKVVNRENGVYNENDKETKNESKVSNNDENSQSIDKDEESTEYIMEYAQANYFNKSRSLIDYFIYYKDEKNYKIDFDSKEGQEIFRLLKSRFVCVGERVSNEVSIGNDVANVKKENKSLEVVFKKEFIYATEPHKNTNYKSIPIKIKSWIFPLEGKYEKYFTYLPESKYTFEYIDSGDIIIEYCDRIVK